MSTNRKIILVLIGHYLPGYKAGGPVRSISNMVDHLGEEHEFRIITCDRDLGNSESYPCIKPNDWQPVGDAIVYYLTPRSCTIRNIAKTILNTPYDVLHLNGFFDPIFTIRVLLARRLGFLPKKPVIVAPRGDFEEGSLKLKYLKKFAYIQIAKVLGLYKNVTWHATNELEALDILRLMNPEPNPIHIAYNVPAKIRLNGPSDLIVHKVSDSEGLRIVFLSRLSREKNLDYALRVLSKVSSGVIFDIYGPAEDITYWKECQKLIAQLPSNVIVNYFGLIHHEQVVNVFSRYDLFFFPTSGENYGHVIEESLVAGTPILTSTATPWRNLQAEGLGWDIDLTQMASFVEIIDKLKPLSNEERLKKQAIIKTRVNERLQNSYVLEANRQLFKKLA